MGRALCIQKKNIENKLKKKKKKKHKHVHKLKRKCVFQTNERN